MEAEYIHHCGSDLTVVNAARVSFDKHHDELTEGDEKLIRYLAKHKHFSPFNHCFATFRVSAPIFVARQLVKHEYMPWNEVSRRYVDSPPEFYFPERLSKRAADKKQGSSDEEVEDKLEVEEVILGLEAAAEGAYKHLLYLGLSPELARSVLPQSAYTQWYWSGTLKAFAKMCNLRCKSDTQYETRLIAKQIDDEMADIFPISWEALREADL